MRATQEQHDHDDYDLDSTAPDTLTSSDEAIRIKFLNCVAELLSHTNGWHHATTTALRERRTRLNSMWPEILASLTRSHTSSRGVATAGLGYEEDT
jgi:hypothetical protein